MSSSVAPWLPGFMCPMPARRGPASRSFRSARSPQPLPSPPLRVGDPVFKVPVLAAFVFSTLYNWRLFGTCSNIEVDKCQIPEGLTSQIARLIFHLGVLTVALKARMFPRKEWTRPPSSMFIAYKFFSSLLIFEFGMSCLWKSMERILYCKLPQLCDTVLDQPIPDCGWKSSILEPICNALVSPIVAPILATAVASLSLWGALIATRSLSVELFKEHIAWTLTTLATVAVQLYKIVYSGDNADCLLSDSVVQSVGSLYWMQ